MAPKGTFYSSKIKEFTKKEKGVLFIFFLINFSFAYKYSFELIGCWGLLVGIIIACLATIIPFLNIWNRPPLRYSFVFASVMGLIAYLLLIHHLPRESLGVDRWSNIHSFWTAYFNGEYAYAARSHMNNPMGSFPFYFIYALPFFLLDNFALLSVFGLLVVGYFFASVSKFNPTSFFPVCLLLLGSMPHLWELMVRSSLMLNTTFVLAFVLIYHRNWPSARGFQIIILGLLGGMLLCKRGVFVIPIAALLIWKCLVSFRQGHILKILFFGLFFTIGFILPFLPLMLNHLEEVLAANPLLVQSNSFIPKPVIYISIGISILIGFTTRQFNQYLLRIGVLLFSIIIVYALNLIYVFGWYEAFYESRIDLSYFIFCMPFLGLYLMSNYEDCVLSVS